MPKDKAGAITRRHLQIIKVGRLRNGILGAERSRKSGHYGNKSVLAALPQAISRIVPKDPARILDNRHFFRHHHWTEGR